MDFRELLGMLMSKLRQVLWCGFLLGLLFFSSVPVHAQPWQLDAPFVVIEGPEPIDLDTWIDGPPSAWQGEPGSSSQWDPRAPKVWQVLPDSILYKSYWAGAHEPRMGVTIIQEKNEGRFRDSALGARIGILRYGTVGSMMPQGFQLDIEGAAFFRQGDSEELVATDFRAGIPLTYAIGQYQTKLAYYHLSSHLGDEYMIRTGATRINFARDVIVWGHSYYWTDALRTYLEVGYAFASDGGSKPWEFQFGAEYGTLCATGVRGAPFLAVNAHLRQEVNYGGNLVAQAGWQWRGRPGGHVLRTGLHYYNGKSAQFEFFDNFEQQLGWGLWYDF